MILDFNNDTLAIDADQVVLDFTVPFRKIGSVMLSKELVSLNNSYHLSEKYGITEEQVKNIFKEMETHPEGNRQFPFLNGAVEALLQLKKDNIKIHMVTAVCKTWHEARLENLANRGVVLDGLHCVGVGACKVDVLRDIRPFAFVDDRLPVLKPLDFIERRIWIDQGDCQQGLTMEQMNVETPHSPIFRYTSFADWVKDFRLSRNFA